MLLLLLRTVVCLVSTPSGSQGSCAQATDTPPTAHVCCLLLSAAPAAVCLVCRNKDEKLDSSSGGRSCAVPGA
jgi:hypothetical protein